MVASVSYRKTLIAEKLGLGEERKGFIFMKHLFRTRYFTLPTSPHSMSKWGLLSSLLRRGNPGSKELARVSKLSKHYILSRRTGNRFIDFLKKWTFIEHTLCVEQESRTQFLQCKRILQHRVSWTPQEGDM